MVSFRLMSALRDIGIDARMLVAEKLTDSEHVGLIGGSLGRKLAFAADRLPVALANGFDRGTLFKIDTAFAGVDISNHRWVKEADVVCLNWVNQGVLGLGNIKRLLKKGKRLVWTMHDMWNMTGICHHAGSCSRFMIEGKEGFDVAQNVSYGNGHVERFGCGRCPLLGERGGEKDMSWQTFERKRKLYKDSGIRFVAVSSWLAQKGRESLLLGNQDVSVIPNAFPMGEEPEWRELKEGDEVRLAFGAARLDDDIKCFPVLVESMRSLRREYPELAGRVRLVLFGGIRNKHLLNGIEVEYEYKGVLKDKEEIRRLYSESDIVISTSSYETLPGTLIEGQANGCFPVSFNRGGQRDIIEQEVTGYMAEWADNAAEGGRRIAAGIAFGVDRLQKEGRGLRKAMRESVEKRFGAESVAQRYERLFTEMFKR